MSQFKQAVCWWCFVPGVMTPTDLLKTAADIGFSAIELAEPEFWPVIQDSGLQIATHRAHGTLTDGLNRRENLIRIERELRTNLDLAVKWNIPNLICFSGNRNGLDDQIGAEITAENLRHLAPLAEDAGVTLILELLNSKVDHPDYQADHTQWGAEVIKRVDSPRVKLLYDIYHMQIMEGDIIRTIQTYHSQIGHYHIAGNPGRHGIDASQELNYRAIVQAIAATGYSGHIGHEFIPVGDATADLKTAFDICAI